MTETAKTVQPNVFLFGKVHLPHPTKRVRNLNTGEMRTMPLCGQRSSRFYPCEVPSAEVTCLKCLREG